MIFQWKMLIPLLKVMIVPVKIMSFVTGAYLGVVLQRPSQGRPRLRFAFTMMNFALNMMNFVLKMMDFVLQMMDLFNLK